jgi:hypothetical protein
MLLHQIACKKNNKIMNLMSCTSTFNGHMQLHQNRQVKRAGVAGKALRASVGDSI